MYQLSDYLKESSYIIESISSKLLCFVVAFWAEDDEKMRVLDMGRGYVHLVNPTPNTFV